MDENIRKYINKQKSSQKEICLALRKIILRTLPKTKEGMKWGAITYDNGKFYIGVVKYGVNLGFSINGLSKEEIRLFEGNGKIMRHVKIESFKDIDEKELIKLIKLVHKKTTCASC